MAGILDYLSEKKDQFVSGMSRLNRAGRKYLSNPTFGPKHSEAAKLKSKKRLEQAFGSGTSMGGTAQAAKFKPKRSMKRLTKKR